MKREHAVLIFLALVTAVVVGFVMYQSKPAAHTSNTVWRDDAPARGEKNARVRLVEFGDFQCPSCKALVPILNDLLARYPHDLQLQYRYYPLPEHGNARAVAEAAEYAHKHGKFWEFHNLVYANQDGWARQTAIKETMTQLMVLLGIETQDYRTGKDSDQIRQVIDTDMQFAQKNQLSGTPSLFINDILYSNELSAAALRKAIDEALVKSL